MEAQRIVRLCRAVLKDETVPDARARLAQLLEYAELVEQQAAMGYRRPSSFTGRTEES
jgi:hypothetical protein